METGNFLLLAPKKKAPGTANPGVFLFSEGHPRSGEPIKLAFGDPEAIVNPISPARPLRNLERPQELPLYPAAHRITRDTPPRGDFFHRQPLLNGIHTCLQT
jgi:hypothetical protein